MKKLHFIGFGHKDIDRFIEVDDQHSWSTIFHFVYTFVQIVDSFDLFRLLERFDSKESSLKFACTLCELFPLDFELVDYDDE